MPALPSDIDYDKEAKSLTDIFLEASSRLAQAEQAESDNRARGLVAIAFRNGQQRPLFFGLLRVCMTFSN